MKTKTVIAAGVASLAASVSLASVRLNNDLAPNNAVVEFSWVIMAPSGPTGWVEVGGSAGPTTDYVDIEDAPCGCPDGFTGPCYQRASDSGTQWSYW